MYTLKKKRVYIYDLNLNEMNSSAKRSFKKGPIMKTLIWIFLCIYAERSSCHLQTLKYFVIKVNYKSEKIKIEKGSAKLQV